MKVKAIAKIPEKEPKTDLVEKAFSELMKNIPLKDVKAQFNSKAGTASVTGHLNGIQYTTTLSRQPGGVIQTKSSFDKGMGRDALKNQIKQLKKEGYKQSEIAGMLGISQPTVSNYLKK